MTSKKNLLLLVVVILLAVLNFLIMPYYYAGACLFLLILLFILCFIPAHVTGKQLEFKVKGGGNGTKEEPFQFMVYIENKSFLPVLSLNFNLITENMVTGERREEKISSTLGPKGKKQIKIQGESSYAGSIHAYMEGIEVSDPFGIHSRKKTTYAEGNYDVYPSDIGAELAGDIFSTYNMESYRYSQKKKGSDPGEIHGIREYVKGDSPKTIHWKLSSKLDTVVVRELGYPVENDIMLILDCNHLDSYEQADRKLNLFTSLAHGLLSRGMSFSAGWYNRKESRFEETYIRDEEELMQSLSRIIKNRMENSVESTITAFLGEDDIEKEHSQYLYVSYDNRDIERLMAYGQIRIYGRN